jgi:hypothetical protein
VHVDDMSRGIPPHDPGECRHEREQPTILHTSHGRAGDHFVGEPSIDEDALTGARRTNSRKHAKRRAVAGVAPESRARGENGAALRSPGRAVWRKARELSIGALKTELRLVGIPVAMELRHVRWSEGRVRGPRQVFERRRVDG